MTQQQHTEWRWYASKDAEVYTICEDSREAVISAAVNDQIGLYLDPDGIWKHAFYIVEARKAELRIADYCLPHDLFEQACDSLIDTEHVDEDGECPGAFDCTDEQARDLERRLRAACDEWQAAHGLEWQSWSFSETQNEERIEMPAEGGGA